MNVIVSSIVGGVNENISNVNKCLCRQQKGRSLLWDLEMKFDFYVVSDEITIYSLKLTVLARPRLDRHTGVKT